MNNPNLYNIQRWGEGYFSIDDQGCIQIQKSVNGKGIPLQTIIEAASNVGLSLPLIIRFTDILHDRVLKIYTAFEEAIIENKYEGTYTLAYPIKVNQEQSIVNALIQNPYRPIALEAGSKPELMAIMGLLDANPTTIICNGYKDKTYIRLALIAQQMGHRVFIIIEKMAELAIILKEAANLGVRPRIGVRVRLTTQGAGNWANTGGSKAKFGLQAEQVLSIIQQLKEQNLLDILQLMHCHLGSQIANIRDIRHCMQEVVQYYLALRRLNVPIEILDVGGGLAVDYQGTHTNTNCSMNYSIKEYANHILLALIPLCKKANQPQPHIFSESGRALTAHHAVLVTNITDIELLQCQELPLIENTDASVLQDIWNTYLDIDANSANETFNYAILALDEANAQFKHGVITLEEKAKVEQIFNAICLKIESFLDSHPLHELNLKAQINERMAAKIFCNLSFFQSLPDAWAIQHIFPVAPITHLNEPLVMHSILEDLTCDSDGTIKNYTDQTSISHTLLLPLLNRLNPYCLGFFLVGAYQEILGNLHNLFGDTNAVEITLFDDGQFAIGDISAGESISEVLVYAHYNSQTLLLHYEKQLNRTQLTEPKKQEYLHLLRDMFNKMTYLDVSP